MLPPTINKHKAVWASSIAIFTLGAVVYFTVYRNSKESSSKPSKKPIQDREIVHKEKKQIDEETSKGRDISNQVDVSQVKATVTLEATDNDQVTSDQQIKVTETEKDASTAETNTMTTTTTTTTTATATAIETNDDNKTDELTESIVQISHQDVKLNDSFVMVDQSTDEKKSSNEQDDDEIEKSPLLTAAPSSSSSSDIASQPDQESKVIVKPTPAPTTSQQDQVKEIKKEKQQDELKKKPMATTASPSVRSATNHLQQQQQQQHMMMNVNNTNGMYINGYWHAPTATTTFQHSMGWPELFPLQQQHNNNNNNETNQVTTLDESTMDEAALKKYNQKEKKRSSKKKMTRLEQIDQQKQNYVPSMKSRCNWWPNCTNKNCKYFHPHQPCRYGDLCIYNERCMFLHPWDYEESYK